MIELDIDAATLPQAPVEQSAFEGLYHRLLVPDPAFAADLKQVGYDLQRPDPSYSGLVFQNCLGVACRHTYPDLPRAEAERLLGKRFLDGYFQTIVGRMISAMLPLLGTAGTLKRLPRLYKSASPATVVSVEQLAEREFRVTMRDRVMNPDFNLGLMESVLEHTGVKPSVQLVGRSPHGADYQLRW